MSLRALALIAAVALAGAARAAEPAAEVVALEGRATADAAPLALGDSIVAGSVVRTGADGKIGVLANDVYVQLDPDTAVLFERDAGDRVKLHLQEGRARIIDTRGGGSPGALRIDDTTATIAGGDSEVYVLNEKAGRYAMFCNWTGPVQVSRDPKSLAADPGNCILSKPREPLYAAKGHDHQIPLLPLPHDAVLFDAPTNHFNPADVAAGPPALGFGDPMDPIAITRDPCDVPGSGCARGAGFNVIEPPPDGGGCAPGVICGPQGPGPEVTPPAPPVVTPPTPVGENPVGGCGPGGGRRGRR